MWTSRVLHGPGQSAPQIRSISWPRVITRPALRSSISNNSNSLSASVIRSPLTGYFMPFHVHSNPGSLDDVGHQLGVMPAAEHCTDPGHQFPMAERLA